LSELSSPDSERKDSFFILIIKNIRRIKNFTFLHLKNAIPKAKTTLATFVPLHLKNAIPKAKTTSTPFAPLCFKNATPKAKPPQLPLSLCVSKCQTKSKNHSTTFVPLWFKMPSQKQNHLSYLCPFVVQNAIPKAKPP
jgi:hypothetical protein